MITLNEEIHKLIESTPCGLPSEAKHFIGTVWEKTYFTYPSIRKGTFGENIAQSFYKHSGYSVNKLRRSKKKQGGGGHDFTISNSVSPRVEAKTSYVRADGVVHFNQICAYLYEEDKGFDTLVFVCIDVDRVLMYSIFNKDFWAMCDDCPYTDHGHKGRSDSMWQWKGPTDKLEDYGFKLVMEEIIE